GGLWRIGGMDVFPTRAKKIPRVLNKEAWPLNFGVKPFRASLNGKRAPAAIFSKSNKVARAAAGRRAAATANARADLTHKLICIDLSCFRRRPMRSPRSAAAAAKGDFMRFVPNGQRAEPALWNRHCPYWPNLRSAVAEFLQRRHYG